MLEFHIEDLLYTKSTIAYQSDRRIPAQRSRLPEGALRIRSVRATRSRSCLCSVRFVLRVTQKNYALSGVEIYSQQGLFPAQSRIFARYCRNVQLAPSSWSVRTHEEISEVITHLVGKTVQHTEN